METIISKEDIEKAINSHIAWLYTMVTKTTEAEKDFMSKLEDNIKSGLFRSVNLAILSVAANHTMWRLYEENKVSLSREVERFWRIVDDWCCDNLNDEEMKFYLNITD